MSVTNQPVTNQPEVDLIETQVEEVAAPPAKKRWPKWAKWALAIALLAAAGIGVERWIAGSQAAISYETVALDRGTIQSSVTATGTLNAVINVLVSSQVSGNIKALYADWNSKVKKDQLVALIDPQIFQNAGGSGAGHGELGACGRAHRRGAGGTRAGGSGRRGGRGKSRRIGRGARPGERVERAGAVAANR